MTKKLITHTDQSGYFRELYRCDENMFGLPVQTNITMCYPGFIKAFHYHKYQSDLWYVVSGNIRVVLIDPETDKQEIIYMGDSNPILLSIPPNVLHGYQVLGNSPAILMYHVDSLYNPKEPDEGRVPYDKIFDWSIKFE